MPSELLYTVIVNKNPLSVRGQPPQVIFELPQEVFEEALQSQKRAEQERFNQFQLVYGNPPSDKVPTNTIYVTKNDCIVYETGKARRLFSHGLELRSQAEVEAHKLAFLEKIGGPAKSLFVKNYVDIYISSFSHPTSYYAQGGSTYNWRPLEDDCIAIKGPDGQLRGTDLKPLSSSKLCDQLEAYRYTVSQDKGQLTLTMNLAKRSQDAGAGLVTLKQYAKNLLMPLNIKQSDTEQYPKIEITGKAQRSLYNKDFAQFNRGVSKTFFGLVALSVSAILLATGILSMPINPLAWVPLTIGAIALIVGVVLCAKGARKMWKAPYKDKAWHQKDLAQSYEAYFKLPPAPGRQAKAVADLGLHSKAPVISSPLEPAKPSSDKLKGSRRFS